MKKLILLAILFFIVHIFSFGQRSAYYDALFFKSIVDDSVFSNRFTVNIQTREIFDYYYPNLNDGEIDAAIKANPFLEPYYITNDGTMRAKVLGIKTPGLLSSIGGLDVTNFSQGLSLFLIERAKQELNIAFFDKFKKFTEKYPEIGILFPHTTNSLSNLLAYQYSQMLPVLREAFYKDLNILPDNLITVMLMDKYFEKMNIFPEFIVVLNSITLLQQINQMTPPQVIESLPDIAKDYKRFTELENLHSSLLLTAIFSNAIRTDSTHYDDTLKNYWISPTEFYNNILSKPDVLNIFMGLIYQKIQMDSITFDTEPFASSIIKNENEIWWYKTQFTKLLTQVDKINSAAHSIQLLKAKGNKPTNQDIYSYVSTTIDLFEFGFDFASHYNSKLKTQKADNYIELSRNANSLYINTISQNYALAMNNTIFILNSISKGFDKKDTNFKKSVFNRTVISDITTYGTFIANMTDADTPEEVHAAIENAALPVGSSSFKKNYAHNIALNAYLGLNAGNWPKDKSTSATWNNNFRLTAPIGITYTPFSFGKGGALSVFTSLLDVGAIVDYQLSNDGKEVDQKIYLSNIFSPGGYIVYGMACNMPISVGFGGQYGPGLIEMGKDLWNPSWRLNIFLAVDIPIINLYKGRGKTHKN